MPVYAITNQPFYEKTFTLFTSYFRFVFLPQ